MVVGILQKKELEEALVQINIVVMSQIKWKV
jgi:hypothetical protein